ncbi:hypothetical protein ACLB1G_18475 [Oxalobacteraceae bacterium A2-2]
MRVVTTGLKLISALALLFSASQVNADRSYANVAADLGADHSYSLLLSALPEPSITVLLLVGVVLVAWLRQGVGLPDEEE